MLKSFSVCADKSAQDVVRFQSAAIQRLESAGFGVLSNAFRVSFVARAALNIIRLSLLSTVSFLTISLFECFFSNVSFRMSLVERRMPSSRGVLSPSLSLPLSRHILECAMWKSRVQPPLGWPTIIGRLSLADSHWTAG